MSKSKKSPALELKEKDTKPAPLDTASGTVVVDGVTYQVKGHATLPTFKIDVGKATLVLIDGSMVDKEKRDKDGPVKDKDGNPAIITVVKVVLPRTGEVGQIVCGAILKRALAEYPGGYIGKQFVLIKGDAPSGKAKPWTVTEVAI
jgi:hypothetical protein